MSGFWKQFREFATILGIAGIFFATIYLGVIRIQEKNQETMESIQQAIVDRKIFDERLGEIPRMRVSWEHIQSADGNLSVFLSKDHIVSLVESLEAIGKDLGVTVVSEASLRPMLSVPSGESDIVEGVASMRNESDGTSSSSGDSEKVAQKETLVSLLPENRSVFITFKVTGSYERVISFLNKLDTMPTLLDVLSVEISPAPEKSGPASIAVSDVASNPFMTSPTLSASTSTSSIATEAASGTPRDVLASFATVIYTTP